MGWRSVDDISLSFELGVNLRATKETGRESRREVNSVVLAAAFERGQMAQKVCLMTYSVLPALQFLAPSSPPLLNRHANRVPREDLLDNVALRSRLAQISELGIRRRVRIKISSPYAERSSLEEVKGFLGEQDGDGFGFGG